MTVENVYQQGEVLSTDLYLHDPFVASDRTDIQFAELIARNIFHEQRGLENDQQESPTQQTLKFSQELSNAGQPHLIGYSEDVPFILITDFRGFAVKFDPSKATAGEDVFGKIYRGDLVEANKYIELNEWHAIRTEDAAATKYEPITKENETVISLYSPVRGREVIGQYELFVEALFSGNKDEALAVIDGIDGYFPDFSNKERLDAVAKFSISLAADGRPDDAKKVINKIAHTYTEELTTDATLLAWEGDALRRIGIVSESIEILEEATTAYQKIVRNPEYRKGKTNKTTRIIAGLRRLRNAA